MSGSYSLAIMLLLEEPIIVKISNEHNIACGSAQVIELEVSGRKYTIDLIIVHCVCAILKEGLLKG